MAISKAIIFDLNGVFIQSPKLSDRFQEKYGVDGSVFYNALKKIAETVYLSGDQSAFPLWKKYLDEWKVNLTEEEFYGFWFSAEKEIPELVAFAKELQAQGIKVIVLSNNFRERTEYYAKTFPFLADFDGVYFSWQTGFTKPNTKAYEKVLSDLNLKPEECIYFDDSEKNIAAASSLGIQSYPFVDLEDTREKLSA